MSDIEYFWNKKPIQIISRTHSEQEESDIMDRPNADEKAGEFSTNIEQQMKKIREEIEILELEYCSGDNATESKRKIHCQIRLLCDELFNLLKIRQKENQQMK